MMSTRNEPDATRATVLFQVAHDAIRPWPGILVGLAAIVLYPDLGESEKQIGYVYAMRDYLPSGFRGLMIAAFFAAYMSTISTQLNWGASYLVNDLYKRFIRKPNTSNESGEPGHYVLASRLTTVLLMLVAMGVSARITSIAAVWDFIFQCGAGLGLVLILRWYWWRVNAWSEITATLVPFAGYALSAYVFHFGFAGGMFFTVGITTAAWLLVTFLTPPEEEAVLQRFYEKVHPGGWWGRFAAGSRERLGPLFLMWLASVLLTYGVLFATGKFLLLDWQAGLWFAALALASSLALRYLGRQARIF